MPAKKNTQRSRKTQRKSKKSIATAKAKSAGLKAAGVTARSGNQTVNVSLQNALQRGINRANRAYTGLRRPAPVPQAGLGASSSSVSAPSFNIQFPSYGANHDNGMAAVTNMRSELLQELRQMRPAEMPGQRVGPNVDDIPHASDASPPAQAPYQVQSASSSPSSVIQISPAVSPADSSAQQQEPPQMQPLLLRSRANTRSSSMSRQTSDGHITSVDPMESMDIDAPDDQRSRVAFPSDSNRRHSRDLSLVQSDARGGIEPAYRQTVDIEEQHQPSQEVARVERPPGDVEPAYRQSTRVRETPSPSQEIVPRADPGDVEPAYRQSTRVQEIPSPSQEVVSRAARGGIEPAYQQSTRVQEIPSPSQEVVPRTTRGDIERVPMQGTTIEELPAEGVPRTDGTFDVAPLTARQPRPQLQGGSAGGRPSRAAESSYNQSLFPQLPSASDLEALQGFLTTDPGTSAPRATFPGLPRRIDDYLRDMRSIQLPPLLPLLEEEAQQEMRTSPIPPLLPLLEEESPVEEEAPDQTVEEPAAETGKPSPSTSQAAETGNAPSSPKPVQRPPPKKRARKSSEPPSGDSSNGGETSSGETETETDSDKRGSDSAGPSGSREIDNLQEIIDNIDSKSKNLKQYGASIGRALMQDPNQSLETLRRELNIPHDKTTIAPWVILIKKALNIKSERDKRPDTERKILEYLMKPGRGDTPHADLAEALGLPKSFPIADAANKVRRENPELPRAARASKLKKAQQAQAVENEYLRGERDVNQLSSVTGTSPPQVKKFVANLEEKIAKSQVETNPRRKPKPSKEKKREKPAKPIDPKTSITRDEKEAKRQARTILPE